MHQLENQGLISVGAIFDEMIREWLRTFEVDQNISDMSLEISMETDDEPMEDSRAEVIPYFSSDVTRLAFLLKNRCDNSVAEKIKSLEVDN
jgi:hypothetical protein